jgi:hypothetical protein
MQSLIMVAVAAAIALFVVVARRNRDYLSVINAMTVGLWCIFASFLILWGRSDGSLHDP